MAGPKKKEAQMMKHFLHSAKKSKLDPLRRCLKDPQYMYECFGKPTVVAV